jgi:HEPN domain-containing protein
LDAIIETLKGLDKTALLPQEHSDKISAIIKKADATLDAELELKTVLSLTPKRFNLEMLLRNPKGFLAKDAWEKLTTTAKKDLASATRCIALNLSTAAAFHLMRCVEEMVKTLYFHFVKTKRMENPMWGPMIQKLSTKNQPRPTKELLEHLDMIRKNFRNPTQHPEKFYSIDEAQDLLHSSIVAINRVCEEVKK